MKNEQFAYIPFSFKINFEEDKKGDSPCSVLMYAAWRGFRSLGDVKINFK